MTEIPARLSHLPVCVKRHLPIPFSAVRAQAEGRTHLNVALLTPDEEFQIRVFGGDKGLPTRGPGK